MRNKNDKTILIKEIFHQMLKNCGYIVDLDKIPKRSFKIIYNMR